MYAGGELSDHAVRSLREHLVGCPGCKKEVSDYKVVIEVSRRAFQTDLRLGTGVIAGIAARAAEESARPRWWRNLVPVIPHRTLAAALAVALLGLGFGLPLAFRPSAPGPEASVAINNKIDMQVAGGAVHLTWSDGQGTSFKVYKSTDPRQLGRGPGQVVRGNQWVDDALDISPIIFYRIEKQGRLGA
jgi:hypothetical protein